MKFSLSKAALIALALEILIVAVLVLIMEREPAKPHAPQPVVMLSFPNPPAPKPVTPPRKEEVTHPKPVHHEQPRPRPREVVQTPKPRIEETAPVAQAVADPLPPAPPEPPKPASPPPAPGVLATFRDEVNAAVQAVANSHYPYAAKMAHIGGKTRVSFTYLDREVSHPVILVSSGFRALDDAAIAAVNAASYPPPPPLLAGKTQQITIWVQFNPPNNLE